MTTFGPYASVYDLLYADKDYGAEVDYIEEVLRRFRPGARSVLDLGCGTGRHAGLLALRGYEVLGVDRSDAMLETASRRLRTLPAAARGRVRLARGDARTFRAGRVFDAVACLFDVVSYQVSDRDLSDTFAGAAAHLGPGGVLAFDCWHGPGVLADPPRERVKEVRGEGLSVVRRASPVHHPERSVVVVGYRVEVTGPAGEVEAFEEEHAMRYLFPEEVRGLLDAAGVEAHGPFRWRTFEAAGDDTWDACYVGVRRG